MRSLVRALTTGGEPLPIPWQGLASLADAWPGNLIVAQAAPGVGKSLFGLCWALGLDRPSLIVSMDTDPRVQALRLAANQSQRTTTELADNLPDTVEILEKLDSTVRWVWHSTLEQLPEMIMAEKEYWGEVPGLVVIDNVGDIVVEESAQGYAKTFRELHRIAREFDTVILGLHHINRGKDPKRDITSGTVAPHLGESMYAGERDALLVLGLWRPRPNELKVAVLKNRTGQDNKWGRIHAKLDCDLDRASIHDEGWTPNEQKTLTL